MEKKLLIVDGTSMLAEAYYKSLTKEVEVMHSLRDSGKKVTTKHEDDAFSTLLRCRKSATINAIQGFMKVLFDAMDKLEPSHLIVNWGAQREDNFRRKLFPGYKDDGKVKDKELLKQESFTKKLLKDIGVFQLESSSLEALDLAGMLINKYKKDFKVDLLARNTLSLQFTDDATVWFKTPAYENLAKRFNLDCTLNPLGTIKFDEDFLLEYKNLKPYQLPDYRALIGNSFSKIPGVKSVGEVTTVALLEEYDSIENLYDDIDACGSHDELVDFGNELTKHLMLPFNPMPYLVKGKDDAFLGKQLATYKREDSDNLLLGLDISEFDLKNVDKVEIVKKLRAICLSPISCKITQGLFSRIRNLDYSALIVSYNPLIFSPSSNISVNGVDDTTSLYELVDTLAQGEELRTYVNIKDSAIKEFGSKLAFDLGSSIYYSDKSIKEREEEAKKSKALKQSLNTAIEARKETSNNNPVVEEIEEPISESVTDTSAVLVEKPREVVCAVSETNCGEDNTKSSTTLSLDKPLGFGAIEFKPTLIDRCALGPLETPTPRIRISDCIGGTFTDHETRIPASTAAIKRNFINLHDDLEESLIRTTAILDDKESTDDVAENDDLTNQADSKSKSNKGLTLLEQMVISKFVCNHCEEEFLLVGSTANYCVKCGHSNIDNN